MRKSLLLLAVALTAFGCAGGQKLLNEAAFQGEVDGKPVSLYTLHAGDVTMQVTNYGARVVSLWTPDRKGHMADIEIGLESLDRYVNNDGERFLGAAVGPVANRIGKGTFTIAGEEYHTPLNNNGNTLHGGELGVDRIVWNVEKQTENELTLTALLKDGQDGFPGNREIKLVYTLTEQNEFKVYYEAVTDKTTPMNLSHHSFFNLQGEGNGDVLGYIMEIHAATTTPVNELLIPTGKIQLVNGSPFDFMEPKRIGDEIDADNDQLINGKGYDHNWVLIKNTGGIEKACDVYDPVSGRGIEVLTDNIGLQFYSGNFFTGEQKGKYGKPINYRAAIALETQHFPDSVNQPDFPSTLLEPGEVYTHTCIYRFYTK